MGKSDRVDVEILYTLENAQTKEIVFEKTEMAALETRSSKTLVFTLPQAATPGRYTLSAQVLYEGLEASSSISLFIVEPPPFVQKPTATQQPVAPDTPQPREAGTEPSIEPPSIQEPLQHSATPQRCEDSTQCTYFKAVKEKDLNACNTLSIDSQKENCKFNVLIRSKGDCSILKDPLVAQMCELSS